MEHEKRLSSSVPELPDRLFALPDFISDPYLRVHTCKYSFRQHSYAAKQNIKKNGCVCCPLQRPFIYRKIIFLLCTKASIQLIIWLKTASTCNHSSHLHMKPTHMCTHNQLKIEFTSIICTYVYGMVLPLAFFTHGPFVSTLLTIHLFMHRCSFL